MIKRFRKSVVLLLLPLLVASFLSVGYSQLTDNSIISMSGTDWSLKVDGSLKTALDSATTPYISSKSATEKELFLTLNSLKDCVAGKVEFKVQTLGLSVYKQLPLNVELEGNKEYSFVNATHALNDKGETVVYRPQNIVNSFACFDSDGRKVLHISASKLVDAKGNSVWVDSDLVDGVLTVYLDVEWLEIATFPVVLDPSFGKTDIGGTTGGASTQLRGSVYTLNESGTATSIKVYCSGTTYVKAAIYNSTDDLVVAQNTQVQQVGAGWATVDIADTVLSAADYHLVLKTDTSDVMAYDSGGTYVYQDATYADDFPSDIGGHSTLSLSVSIYVEYTTEATPTPTPTATPTPSPAPSVTPIVNGDLTDTEWFVSALMLVLVVVNIVLIAVPFALVRFVFGALAFSLSALAFTLDQIPLSPYLQIMSMVVSVVCMFLAARARE